MIRYGLLLLFAIVIEPKGSFPCPVRKSKQDCENAGCVWVIGRPRPDWCPPWLWYSRNRCWYQ